VKYNIYSFFIFLAGILLILTISFFSDLGEGVLGYLNVPQNSSQVAGIQKYYRSPQSKGMPVPDLTSRATFIKDLTTDNVLYQKNAGNSLPIASTTKIMTAIVASEYYKSNSPLTVKDGYKVDGAKVGVVGGEVLSFRSLLYGMLLNSGNDAAYVIAENYPGGVSNFVLSMNQKAGFLGLENTYFDNPAGFDSPNHFSSAKDLTRITEEALKDPQLVRIFATKDTEVTSLDKKNRHGLHNLNKLLSQVRGVLGVKTGYTAAAKENLVTLVERDEIRILVVVLGSDDRFGESTDLIEWSYNNFSWVD